MKKTSFFPERLLIVVLLLFLGCTSGGSYYLKPDEIINLKPNEQFEVGIEIIEQTYHLVTNEYYKPVSANTMLFGSVKGIENLVGDTGYFILEDGHQIIIHPLTQKPIDKNINHEEGQQALKDIYSFIVNSKSDYKPLNIAHSAIGGMLESLDSHSTFLPREAFEDNDSKGRLSGIGIHIKMRDDFVTVISPIVGSPADKAGIASTDRIIKVDGKITKNIRQTVNMLRGPKGTKVVVTILRQGVKEPIEFEMVRDVIPIESVKAVVLKPGYGYVWISNFNSSTTSDLKKALKKFESEEGSFGGLILDFRDNGGGRLDQAIKVSDLFLEFGTILSVKGRHPNNTRKFTAHPLEANRNYPIVIIINEYSAAASEIVAGALQDNKRALVLGTKSLGHGSVQTIETLRDGSGLKLTIATCYTPSGRSIQTEAIEPDIVVKARFVSEKDIFYSDKYLFKEKDEKKHLKIAERLELDNQVRRALEVLVQTEK
ncbi:MAG: S41 family peptidase [Deltaproteobacteria bacterium]|nr:S41 family peptidase [Deltaproteobacteria bacterium]